MGKHIDQATQALLLADIKNGMKVVEAAAKHGVHVKTAYALLRRNADNTGTSALEIAKLRRENAELKEIIGLLTLEKKRGEKNRGGS
jgi:phosphotransferase system HPr-like phosphotransfer protein